MASKNIGIKEEVYERLKAHKRGDESFSEAIDRILRDLDADWRTNAGFLSEEDAAELGDEVASGMADLDDAVEELGDGVDERLRE
jgi:predicted CopG family antitoxin